MSSAVYHLTKLLKNHGFSQDHSQSVFLWYASKRKNNPTDPMAYSVAQRLIATLTS